eukprot:s1618_g5.t1
MHEVIELRRGQGFSTAPLPRPKLQDGAQNHQIEGLPCPRPPQRRLILLATVAALGLLHSWPGPESAVYGHAYCHLLLTEIRCEFLPSVKIADQGQVGAGPFRQDLAHHALCHFPACRLKEQLVLAAPEAVLRPVPKQLLPRHPRMHQCPRPERCQLGHHPRYRLMPRFAGGRQCVAVHLQALDALVRQQGLRPPATEGDTTTTGATASLPGALWILSTTETCFDGAAAQQWPHHGCDQHGHDTSLQAAVATTRSGTEWTAATIANVRSCACDFGYSGYDGKGRLCHKACCQASGVVGGWSITINIRPL